ncbi:MAG TPA: hypothetical protein VH478_10045 [Trebonia sp.]|nr:hypothetical protein [Trebonia sp.]
MTRVAAIEFAPRRITVNAVAPGSVATGPFEAMTPPQRERAGTAFALGRIGEPATSPPWSPSSRARTPASSPARSATRRAARPGPPPPVARRAGSGGTTKSRPGSLEGSQADWVKQGLAGLVAAS